jgi:diacylglycerol kinase (ATP)
VRLLLVHNPKAGDEDHSRERVESVLRDAGHDISYRSVKDEDWRDALADQPELLVIAGGDGTVCEVLITLAAEPVPATILPMGSANNIARTLGYPDQDPRRLVEGWSTATRRPFDIWSVEPALVQPRFVESMGGGIFADVLARAKSIDDDSLDKVELGLRLLADAIEAAREQSWELSLDGAVVTERLLALEVMNIRELGPNIPVAPDADPGDGMLEVVLIRSEHRAALAAYVDARGRSGHAEPPRLDLLRAQRLTVRPPPETRLRLDDELVDEDEERTESLSCAAAARLELLVPASR